MKTIVHTLIVSLLVHSSVQAGHPPAAWTTGAPYATSTFEIRSQGSMYFSVAVDGRYFPNPVKRFSLGSVTPGMHHVEIFADVKVHGQYTQLTSIYKGNVYIEPGALVTGVVDNMGRFYVKSVKQLPAYSSEPPAPYYPYQEPQCYPAPAPKPLPMSSQSFRQLMDVLDDQWFESGKLQVAEQAISTNWFTADQVLDMMEVMSFEESRLDIARSAYVKTIDRERYFIVNKGFWFSSSVDALNLYIAGL